uniref:Large ribosomal subunit protein uL3c n=1 Tax=Theileria annulata TaxID=5874 RepID=A0A3B0MV22_THEAN
MDVNIKKINGIQFILVFNFLYFHLFKAQAYKLSNTDSLNNFINISKYGNTLDSDLFRLYVDKERDLPPTDRILIFKDPKQPRDYLWKTRWPETAKMVQLRAIKHGVGQITSPDGIVETVTALRVLPCTILQFMDFGYALVSYGTFNKYATSLLKFIKQIFNENIGKPLWTRHWNNRPELGKLIKISANNAETFPVKLQPPQDYVLGQLVDVSSFVGCTHAKVTGITKGKGFQGVIKRHGFKRGPMSHGSKHHRRPGSIGASTTPGCVKPGKKMPGRMGGKRCTFRKLKILGINPETSLLYVKGHVAGPKGSYVTVTSDVQPPLKQLLK